VAYATVEYRCGRPTPTSVRTKWETGLSECLRCARFCPPRSVAYGGVGAGIICVHFRGMPVKSSSSGFVTLKLVLQLDHSGI
jgi:hypothetical protein